MSGYVWFLIAAFAFMAAVYFFEELDQGIRHATLSTLGGLASVALLFLVGGALWALVPDT